LAKHIYNSWAPEIWIYKNLDRQNRWLRIEQKSRSVPSLWNSFVWIFQQVDWTYQVLQNTLYSSVHRACTHSIFTQICLYKCCSPADHYRPRIEQREFFGASFLDPQFGWLTGCMCKSTWVDVNYSEVLCCLLMSHTLNFRYQIKEIEILLKNSVLCSC
jgi:hypothetical protein